MPIIKNRDTPIASPEKFKLIIVFVYVCSIKTQIYKNIGSFVNASLFKCTFLPYRHSNDQSLHMQNPDG